jgi:8-oxo-dGTP pyrophosphatase MutT (NUDIX family)
METWDLYDDERRPLHRTGRRGDALAPGENHLVAEVWTVNNRNEILVTRRDDQKYPYPGKWENTGGAVTAGEDTRTAAARELFEETGIRAEADELTELGGYRVPYVFADVYLIRRDVSLRDLTLQPGETVEAKWVSLAELEAMRASGELAFPTRERLKFIKDALKPDSTRNHKRNLSFKG